MMYNNFNYFKKLFPEIYLQIFTISNYTCKKMAKYDGECVRPIESFSK